MADTLKTKATAQIDKAKTKAKSAIASGKDKAGTAYSSSKAKANKAAQSSKESAKRAAQTTADTVDKNPLIALVGGLALGAIAAALLPRTQRENKLVGKVGNTVRTTAKNAAKNATDTAKAQLNELGVNAEEAKQQLRDLANKVTQAASSAGSAAADSIKKK